MAQQITFAVLFIALFHFRSSVPYNVLFITVDDLRPTLGVFDNKYRTPYIDKFSEEAYVFQKAYAQFALCAPSRNSFLTSRRPDTTKLYDFYSYWRDVAGNFTTLPQYLKQGGYHTFSIGKVFHEGEASNFTDDYPYSWSEPAWHPSTQAYKDSATCFSNGGWHANVICPVKLEEQPENSLPDIQSTQRAIEFIKQQKGRTNNFFLGLGYHKPHVPFKFPEKFLDFYPIEEVDLPPNRTHSSSLPDVAWNPWNDLRSREDIQMLNISYPFGPIEDKWVKKLRQAYYSSVTYVDDLFGQVINSLQENGFENNTIVILLGDHGWSLGEHGEWGKFSNFDLSLRVPLIIKVPNRTNKTVHVQNIVELVDIFPSLVDLLGLPAIPACQKKKIEETCTEGQSFAPIFSGGVFNKTKAFSQYPRPGIFPTKKPNSDRPLLEEIAVMGYTIKTPEWRYTRWAGWNNFTVYWSDIKGEELYNHQNDPNENINLAEETKFHNVIQELSNELKEMISLKVIDDDPQAFTTSSTITKVFGLLGRGQLVLEPDVLAPVAGAIINGKQQGWTHIQATNPLNSDTSPTHSNWGTPGCSEEFKGTTPLNVTFGWGTEGHSLRVCVCLVMCPTSLPLIMTPATGAETSGFKTNKPSFKPNNP